MKFVAVFHKLFFAKKYAGLQRLGMAKRVCTMDVRSVVHGWIFDGTI